MRNCLTIWVLLAVYTGLSHASPVKVDFGDYVNGFLVEVENAEEAEEVARSHGFRINDQVGTYIMVVIKLLPFFNIMCMY